jgi:hypothetical protein
LKHLISVSFKPGTGQTPTATDPPDMNAEPVAAFSIAAVPMISRPARHPDMTARKTSSV